MSIDFVASIDARNLDMDFVDPAASEIGTARTTDTVHQAPVGKAAGDITELDYDEHYDRIAAITGPADPLAGRTGAVCASTVSDVIPSFVWLIRASSRCGWRR